MKTDDTNESPVAATNSRSWFSTPRRYMKRLVQTVVGFIVLYLLLAIVGLIPVNRDFHETDPGVEIWIFSGAFHSDIIVPIQTEVFDWRTEIDSKHFSGDIRAATHMAFGWGDKNFYIATPTWKDLKFSTAFNALLIPSETVMHVNCLTQPASNPNIRSVKISADQYQRLVDFILGSFERDHANEIQHMKDVSYTQVDAFYRGDGNYHCFRTCNCWVGDGLQAAGIKTGWFTPFPKTVLLYLPE